MDLALFYGFMTSENFPGPRGWRTMRGLPQKCARRGFTLVEVTVTMGIFAIIMLGLAAVAGISVRGGYVSKQRLRATYLATWMLETISSPGIVANTTDLTLFNGDDTANPATYQNDVTGAITAEWAQMLTQQMGPGTRGTITVAAMTQPVANGNFRITVTVTWPFRGRTGSVTMVAVR